MEQVVQMKAKGKQIRQSAGRKKDRVLDMTEGSPIRVILLFTIPLLLGNIFQQLYNMGDSKIVSAYVGTRAFAAVGATAVISNTITGIVNGFTQGFAVPAARAVGARDERALRRYVAGSIRLTVIITAVLMAVSFWGIRLFLSVLSTPAEIMDLSLSYIRIILVGTIFVALYNLGTNMLRAVGDSQTPLYFLIASVILNIGLDLLFVAVFHWGVAGAAWATVISQAAAAFLATGFILKRFRYILPEREDWKARRGESNLLFTTGLSMALMSCIVNLGTLILQSAINGLGTNIIAAHTAARRVFEIMSAMMFTEGTAMTTFVSQNMGAGKLDRIHRGVREILLLEEGVAILLILFTYTLGTPLLTWILSSAEPAVLDPATRYLRFSCLFFFFLGPLFILRNSMQGMGRRVAPLISSVMELCIKYFSAHILVPRLGYFGIILAEPISWVLMVIVLAILYLTRPVEKLVQKQDET